jgi:RNA polymerase sigma-70 factor (ECF subfamily)
MESNSPTYTDQQIIQGCMKADRKFQELLYKKFSAKMYAVCLRYAGEVNSAQDVLQDGFVKVFTNIEKFRGEGSFEGWVRRIFVNTSLEFIRKKSNLYIAQEPDANKMRDFDENGLQKLMKEDILEMIQSLSTGYRTIFNLYIVEGFSHKEIAEMLNVSEGTSKSQLARERYILKERLETKMKFTSNNNYNSSEINK